MEQPRVLLTGGYGCIGAATAKWLLRNSDAQVVICSRRVSEGRTERVFYDVDRRRLVCLPADVTDSNVLLEMLRKHRITQVAHLAALQTPDCNADRDLGLQINLAGTQRLIEALKASELDLQRFVFASSIAVYGPRAAYPPGQVSMLASPDPVNVYGVWKLAAEQLSKLFCRETGVPTLCLRPGVLFGPGRDAGLTSTPTTAIKSVALGRPYTIPYRNHQDYLYAPDVGAAFGMSLLHDYSGFGVYTLPGRTLDTSTWVASLQRAAQRLDLASACRISIGDGEVPFICELEYQPFLDRFPNAPRTALDDALQQSLEVFMDQARRGWLTTDTL